MRVSRRDVCVFPHQDGLALRKVVQHHTQVDRDSHQGDLHVINPHNQGSNTTSLQGKQSRGEGGGGAMSGGWRGMNNAERYLAIVLEVLQQGRAASKVLQQVKLSEEEEEENGMHIE